MSSLSDEEKIEATKKIIPLLMQINDILKDEYYITVIGRHACGEEECRSVYLCGGDPNLEAVRDAVGALVAELNDPAANSPTH